MRKIEAIKLKTDAEIKTDELSANPRKWLEDNSSGLKPDSNAKDKTVYLLSFHDDGVIWGKLKTENGTSKLLTSDELKDSQGKPFPSPEFRVETLQACRLFSERGELYVWRNDNGFKARLIEDNSTASDTEEREYFDEAQVLHGTQIDKDKDGNLLTNGVFTVVVDGSEGLRHAFPQQVLDEEFKIKDDKGRFLKNTKGEEVRKRPLRLCVRHYLSYDDDGCAYVSLSRLIKVGIE